MGSAVSNPLVLCHLMSPYIRNIAKVIRRSGRYVNCRRPHFVDVTSVTFVQKGTSHLHPKQHWSSNVTLTQPNFYNLVTHGIFLDWYPIGSLFIGSLCSSTHLFRAISWWILFLTTESSLDELWGVFPRFRDVSSMPGGRCSLLVKVIHRNRSLFDRRRSRHIDKPA